MNIRNLIDKENIEFVDFRFTDLNGKWKNISFISNKIDENFINNGISFDGSSILGWKNIEDSDMLLKPDVLSSFIDPFSSTKNLVIICDIFDPKTNNTYNKDPRSLVKRAMAYFKSTKIGDEAFFGPEIEFFLFDDVRFNNSSNRAIIELDSEELSSNSNKKYEFGNLAYRNMSKSSYFSCSPNDMFSSIRYEILKILKDVGLSPSLHHHEVASSQQEIGFDYSNLLDISDKIQISKYVIKNVSNSFGKSASFMPKPISEDNGSGMHVHQSLWKSNKPIFSGDLYAGLSQECLYYIGGIIKHAKSINAFCNPSTNSYKRLVSGYEAPVVLAYSKHNRSASIRIPHSCSDKDKRIETRFPDATANPYLAFSAILMAGIDGIKNKINPGDAVNENLYLLNDSDLKKHKKVAKSLEEAIDHLDENRKFLKEDDVFNDEIIDSYIEIKRDEIKKVDNSLNPMEFSLYYDS